MGISYGQYISVMPDFVHMLLLLLFFFAFSKSDGFFRNILRSLDC